MVSFPNDDLTTARRALIAAAGDRLDWRRVRFGLADDLTAALRDPNCPVPAGCVAAVVEAGDGGALAALLANTTLDAAAAETVFAASLDHLDDRRVVAALIDSRNPRAAVSLSRMAATGDVHLIAADINDSWADPELRRTLLAAADSPEAVSLLTTRTKDDVDQLRAAVVSPVPEVVRHALKTLGPKLSERDQLEALRSMLSAGVAPGDLAARLAGVTLRPGPARVLAGLADGGSVVSVDRELAAAADIDGLLAEMTDRRTDHVAHRLTGELPVDWERLSAAASRKPFNKEATVALVSRPDCPDALRDLLFTAHPVPVVEQAARCDGAMLRLSCPPRSRAKATRELLARELGRGIAVEDAYRDARPARALLEYLHDRSRHDGAEQIEAVAKLRDRFHVDADALLADDTGRWRAVRALLETFEGTVGELLAAAVAADPTPDAPIPGLDRGYEPWEDLSSLGMALMELLSAAPAALLYPGLSDSDRRRLVGYRSQWRDDLIDHLVAVGDADLAERMVRAGRPTAEQIDRLAPLYTPSMVMELLCCDTSTDEQRARWLADPSPELRALLLRSDAETKRFRLTDRLLTTDEEVRRAMGGVHRQLPTVRGTTPQLRMVLGLWERYGPELVKSVQNVSPFSYETYRGTREVLAELLDREDTDAAFAELTRLVVAGETAEAQIEHWRRRRDRAALAEENHRWHWDALLAEHRREPFAPDAVFRMSRLSGCPEEIRGEAAGVLPSRYFPGYTALMAGKSPATVLRNHAADDRDRDGVPWLFVALKAGRLGWDDVLRHAHPARSVLAVAVKHDEAVTALAERTTRILGEDTDGWLLAVQMLPGFTGTVDELLSTAATAVEN